MYRVADVASPAPNPRHQPTLLAAESQAARKYPFAADACPPRRSRRPGRPAGRQVRRHLLIRGRAREGRRRKSWAAQGRLLFPAPGIKSSKMGPQQPRSPSPRLTAAIRSLSTRTGGAVAAPAVADGKSAIRFLGCRPSSPRPAQSLIVPLLHLFICAVRLVWGLVRGPPSGDFI
jgi:hypothetical protein